jgi:tripartite-type tricarboxylate transporter receptor subunit TctC
MRNQKSKFSSLFLAVLLGGSLFAVAASVAQAAYPEKAVKMIISFAPGGITDLVGRALAQSMNETTGNRIYVENVVGAGGSVGFQAGARAPADGYTVTLMVSSITVGPHVRKDYPTYDQFDYVATIAQNPMIIVVRSDGEFKSAKDIVAKAKTRQLNACHAGPGSLAHLAIAAYAKAANITLNLIPYKGAGPCMTALLGGVVDIAPQGVVEAISYIQGKRINAVVTLGTERSRVLPDVPTGKELGQDAAIHQWTALAVPNGTPPEVKRFLQDGVRKAVTEDQKFQAFLNRVGLESILLYDEEAKKYIQRQNEYFKGVVNDIGLRPE